MIILFYICEETKVCSNALVVLYSLGGLNERQHNEIIIFMCFIVLGPSVADTFV